MLTKELKETKKNIMDTLIMKAKFITLATFIILCILCFLGLTIGLIFIPSAPFIILEGIEQIANIIFQFFVVIATGVAVTGAGSSVISALQNGKNNNGSVSTVELPQETDAILTMDNKLADQYKRKSYLDFMKK